MCVKPLTAYWAAERNSNGKRGLVWKHDKASLSGAPVRIPCGQCVECRLNKARTWATRCMNEKRMHKASSFLTLTYNDENLPLLHGPLVRHRPTLVKQELQRFMKRLRHKTGSNLRFYACGEYGEDNLRPHYHVLLFNFDFADKLFYSRGKEDVNYYTSPLLSELWPVGHAITGDVTFKSCSYVARYVVDKITGDKSPQYYAGRCPEFSLMSLKPGIGHGYYMKYAHEIYAHDSIILDGKEVPPPRYYDDLYSMLDSMAIKDLKKNRRRKALLKRANNTPDRRRTRELVAIMRLRQIKRNTA